MSESTSTMSSTFSDSSDEYLKYRELSMGAVAALVLGILSFIAIPFVTLAVIPLFGTSLVFVRCARSVCDRQS